MKNLYAPAVILDINYSGYGVVKSLFGLGMDLVAFKPKGNFIPESKSRMINKIFSFSSEKHLFSLLSEFKHCDKKPILYLTSDYYVKFISANKEHFHNIFSIVFPDSETIDLLMNKDQFSEFAIKNKILIPKTYKIFGGESNLKALQKLEFPVVIKPSYRKQSWNNAGFPKVFCCNNEQEYMEFAEKALSIEKDVIVQEYIPGGDAEIYYCLTYYDKNSRCLGSFTGKKIRQWPVDTGSTASTTVAGEEFIKSETIRIFNILNFRGFGSIEYKRNPLNNKFYIMEPTVGRLNQQEFVATLHGVNLPLIAYKSQTHLDLSIPEIKNKVIIYIDEWAELKSTISHLIFKKMKPKEWYKSLKGVKAYRYWNKKDPKVFFYSIFWFIGSLLNNKNGIIDYVKTILKRKKLN